MSEFWIKLVEQKLDNKLSVFQFWDGIDVWIKRPHLVNRKLLSTEVLKSFTVSHINYFVDMSDELQYYANRVISNEKLKEHFSTEVILENDSNQELDEHRNNKRVILFRKLIPRNLSKFSEVLEHVIRDEKENVVTFWPNETDVANSAITPNFPYRIKLDDNRIVIEIYRKKLEHNVKEAASKEWLKSCVLPKIIKWCCFAPTESAFPSLNLVSAKCYSRNYNYLKEKYATKYIEIWPECSDPLKYVYEDIAIAAYLLTLWEKERNNLNLTSKQTFVDLGCGNGLLADILVSEGHIGIGIDVRKRKIWDLYEKNTVLIERTIEPSDYNIFPNYDWIIGNHSDELTPWIPVIAARSSYSMRVFLLPCCPFTFNGKYRRCSPGKTQYQSYMSFIHKLCECMGFIVQKDKLRIPSTKRTCLVCMSRDYKEDDEKNIEIQRKDFIQKYSTKSESLLCKSTNLTTVKQEDISSNVSVSKEANWITDFKPRDRVEVVQNCTKLDRKFLETTVSTVAGILLKTENYVSLERDSGTISWNSGGKIKLSDLIQLIDPNTLKCMKNQCGGFQTFLRNHRNVFQIKEGYVQLNIPVKGIPLNSQPGSSKKSRRIKQYNFHEKPCFFFFNHPQSCPLEANDCYFSHQIKK